MELDMQEWAALWTARDTLNGFFQIKAPQLPFFPIMAPEANVLKRKQKNCFTSHKWGRDTVGERGT